jgi:hypothetical protein
MSTLRTCNIHQRPPLLLSLTSPAHEHVYVDSQHKNVGKNNSSAMRKHGAPVCVGSAKAHDLVLRNQPHPFRTKQPPCRGSDIPIKVALGHHSRSLEAETVS